MSTQPDTSGEGRAGRFERRVLGPGIEPDPRYSLANERTFLAWIRTALTLIGGGVAIEAFAGTALSFVARRGLALALVCLGMLLAAASCYRWVTLERAMRQGKAVATQPAALVLAAGVTLAAVVLGMVDRGARDVRMSADPRAIGPTTPAWRGSARTCPGAVPCWR